MVFYVIFNVTLLRLVDSHVRGSGDVCFFFVLSPKRSLSFQYQEIHQLLPLSDIEPSHHVPKFPKFPKNHTHNYCISTDNQIICVQLKTGVSDLLFSNIILLSFVVDVYMGGIRFRNKVTFTKSTCKIGMPASRSNHGMDGPYRRKPFCPL